MSPTQRSLALLRKQWPLVQVTERWNAFAKVRQDLFGFCDILCCAITPILAVQTTTMANLSARFEKMRHMNSVAIWLRHPNRQLVIHGWAKRGPRGCRKTWQCRVVRLYLAPDGQVQMAEPQREAA